MSKWQRPTTAALHKARRTTQLTMKEVGVYSIPASLAKKLISTQARVYDQVAVTLLENQLAERCIEFSLGLKERSLSSFEERLVAMAEQWKQEPLFS